MNHYLNRELSWLKFNTRVLEESQSESVPVFERLRFVAICSSNLDEFFMVRAGSMHDRALMPDAPPDNKTGMTARQQLDAMYAQARILYRLRDVCHSRVCRQLEEAGVVFRMPDALDEAESKIVQRFLKKEVLPLVTPQIIDAMHPLPHLENKRLYLLCSMKNEQRSCFGMISLPASLPRLLELPARADGQLAFVRLEDILLRHSRQLFKPFTVQTRAIVRLTRNADVEVADTFSDEDIDYRDYVNFIIKRRERSAPIRLELYTGDDRRSVKLCRYLAEKLRLEPQECFDSETPLDLDYVDDEMQERLEAAFGRGSALFYAPLTPQKRRTDPQFRSVTGEALHHDIFLSYPFYSMEPYLLLLKEAAESPETVSIRITLYRLSNRSEIVNLLCLAAQNGKEVTALVELKARFDESNNIHWSKRLEEAGCHVIYGIEGLKVHGKITLITRRTGEGVQLITHIGSGNYNEKTAQSYTDVGIITSDSGICADAVEFFANMTLGLPEGSYHRLLVAPNSLKPGIVALIREQAALGKDGYIRLKLNSLTDKEILDELVAASCAGVSIDLIVRGICCLQPGIPSLSENIRVYSIVGRFLEHSRIYVFGRGDTRKVLIGSADLMTRNTSRRVEILTPVLDRTIARRLYDMTEIMLADNVKRRMLCSNGEYKHVISSAPPLDSQIVFYRQAYAEAGREAEFPEKG